MVEDDDDLRELLREALTLAGCGVESTNDAHAALSMFQSVRPSVLISDIELGGSSGHELIRAIRRLSPNLGGDVPALALTGHSRREDRKRALDAGFNSCAAKPIDIRSLVRLVAALTGTR